VNYNQGVQRLLFTVTLGYSFTILQVYEYTEACFTFSDLRYGSTFFLVTYFACYLLLAGFLLGLFFYSEDGSDIFL
jgi:cytochrome c oxidase subunit 3